MDEGKGLFIGFMFFSILIYLNFALLIFGDALTLLNYFCHCVFIGLIFIVVYVIFKT